MYRRVIALGLLVILIAGSQWLVSFGPDAGSGERLTGADPAVRDAGVAPALQGSTAPDTRLGVVPAPQPVEATSGNLSVLVVAAETGHQVAGAAVFTAPHAWAVVQDNEAVVRTDQEGRCEVTGPTSEGLLCVIAGGFRSRATRIADRVTEMRVEMEPGGCISGVVVDVRGEPLAGARVTAAHPGSLWSWPQDPNWLVAGLTGAEGPTDSQGRFKLCGLASDVEYAVSARKQGYLPDPKKRWVHVRPESPDVQVRLLRGAAIDVRFIDSLTGNPIGQVDSYVSGLEGTVTVGYLASGAPSTAERDRQLWRGERAHIRLARAVSEGQEEGRTLRALLNCSRLGYRRKSVDLSIDVDREEAVEVQLDPLPDVQWITSVPEASYTSGRAYDGDLALTISGKRGSLIVVRRFVKGKAKTPITVPAGLYRLDARGEPETGRFWTEAGATVRWEASDGREGPRVSLRGNPLSLTVRGPVDQNVGVYEIGIQPEGSRMVRWQSRWVLDVDSDTPLMVPPGTLRIFVQAHGGALNGQVEIEAPGGGGALATEIWLQAK